MSEFNSSIDPLYSSMIDPTRDGIIDSLNIDPLRSVDIDQSTVSSAKRATTLKALGGQLSTEIEVQVRKLRIPLVVFALFLFCMKFIPIWLFFLCLFFTGDALFPYLPARMRNQIVEWILKIRSKIGCDTKMLKNLREAARALKPFLMTALFFAAAPVAVIWMTLHYVGRLFKRSSVSPETSVRPNGAVVFKQNVSKEKDEETAFFHSRAFAVTLIAIVGMGLPVAVIMFLYSVLGIGHVLNETIRDPFISSPYASKVLPPPTSETYAPVEGKVLWPNSARRQRLLPAVSKVYTYEANPIRPIGLDHFATYVYIMSLAWCLSVLFMRAWITFPLNFASTEYDIEVDSDGVRKNSIKGWFAEFLWYCWPGFTPSFLSWSEVKRVDYEQGGFGRLSPLPATLFSKTSIAYKCLNRLAIATDACVDRVGRSEYISFDDSEEQSVSRIKINLWELSSDDKARLFYAIRTHAPGLYINPLVQEKLIGSRVLKEARYTEIWFGLLTSEQERKRQDSLNPGDSICGGKYTVKEKIGAGGQAAVFLVSTSTGEELVLKEFILTTADAFGALVESATDFENESSILSRLDHPSVVKFVDIFAEDKRAYIVLEHVKGVTLRREVGESGPLNELQVVERGLRMCEILRYLHGQSPPVVHRDFTPENLIKQEDGSLKVVDFSVASRSGPHKSGDCVGKHSYTPPEQFRSQACPQSDIYALGATLHFLVTGADPKPITMSDPRNQNSNVSEKIASIIMKCTALDLGERYESVEWLRLDLEELRSSLETAVKPDPVSLALVSNEPLPEETAGVIIKMSREKNKQVIKTAKKKIKRQRSK